MVKKYLWISLVERIKKWQQDNSPGIDFPWLFLESMAEKYFILSKIKKPPGKIFPRGLLSDGINKEVGSGELSVQVFFGQLLLGVFK